MLRGVVSMTKSKGPRTESSFNLFCHIYANGVIIGFAVVTNGCFGTFKISRLNVELRNSISLYNIYINTRE